MNAKRQTVWLVSMLSLMVVLSAYYLFTDNSGKMDMTTENTKLTEADMPNAEEVTDADLQDSTAADAVEEGLAADDQTDLSDDGAAQDQAVTEEDASADDDAIDQGDAAADDSKAESADDSAASDDAAVKSEEQTSDEAVLKEMTSAKLSGQQYFDSLQMKRSEQLSKEVEKWNAILTDMSKSSEEVAKAQNQLQLIEDRELKQSDIEEQLLNEFANAIVTEESNKWKVIVQADKLEKSQAVAIVEMVTKELSVTPDKVAVQYAK